MFDIGWSEMALIAVVSVIFIGPKELPTVLRTMGKWTRKAREMTREFQGGLDELLRESELDQVRKQIDTLKYYDVAGEVNRTVDPDGEIRRAMAPPGMEEPVAPSAARPAASQTETVPGVPVPELTPPPVSADDFFPPAPGAAEQAASDQGPVSRPEPANPPQPADKGQTA